MTPIEQQVVLVTGATDGLGQGVALELAKRGATVLVHGRDSSRISRTIDAIVRVSRAAVRGYRADFSALSEVRALAAEITETEQRLDALVNNAGIGMDSPGRGQRMLSQDGYELRLAVNYLAHFLLTQSLLPLLESSAPARIVNVSSAGQQPIDFEDLMLEHGYSGTRAYRQSKLAQILFTNTLAEQLEGTGITVNAIHPATFMPTKMVKHPASPLEEGVAAVVRLITDRKLDSATGRYFEGQRESAALEQAYDPQARSRLWEISTELTRPRAARAA